MQPVNCHHCGAPMQPGADGRVYACGYCGTRAQVAVGADQIAAGMALDMSNIDVFLGQLAHALQQAVPQNVRVEASGGHVHALDVTLDPDEFVLRREGTHVSSQYKKLVRGIALKTRDLPLQEWVHMLAQSLARHANVNAQTAEPGGDADAAGLVTDKTRTGPASSSESSARRDRRAGPGGRLTCMQGPSFRSTSQCPRRRRCRPRA